MSSTVDNRVVKMTFDNESFEKNAGTTLSTIAKLKNALQFDTASKGLESLQSNIRNISFDGLAAGISSISSSFDSLSIIGITALQRLTNAAIDTGQQIVSALTINPVKMGLDEYTTQINAIQTILSNTRDSLASDEGITEEADQIERINGVLDDLNHYADMTIYNFTEMTRNIGTFTAAGVQLDKAQSAIKGIANLAAMSGSNSEQASRAMYQLSQALAAGVVHLQDWNSVVNAGMGGKLFQDAILDTAKHHGVDVEGMKEMSGGSFRSMLNAKDFGDWFNGDILLESLEKFTAGSEGFTKEQIEQQKELYRSRGYSERQIEELTASMTELTEEQYNNIRATWAAKGYTDAEIDAIFELGNSATEAATKVKTFNQLLETIGEALQSGWTQSWEYIVGDFTEAKMLWTEISDIMQSYISASANARNNELAIWSQGELDEEGNRITEGLTGREMVIQGIRNAFQALYEIMIQVNEAWRGSFLHAGAADDLSITAGKLITLSQQFMDYTQKLKDTIVQEGQITNRTQKIRDTFDKLFTSLRKVYNGFETLIKLFAGSMLRVGIGSFFKEFNIFDEKSGIVQNVNRVAEEFEKFAKILSDKVFTNKAVSSFFEGLSKAVKTLVDIKFDIFISAWTNVTKLIGSITNDWKDVSSTIESVGKAFGILSTSIKNITFDEKGISRFDKLFGSLGDDILKYIDTLPVSLGKNPIEAWAEDLGKFIEKDPAKIFGILERVLKSITNILETLYTLIKPIIDAFLEVFTLEDVVDLLDKVTLRIYNFTEAIKVDGNSMSDFKDFWVGLFKVIEAIGKILSDIGFSIFDGLGKTLTDLLPKSDETTKSLGELGRSLSDFADKLTGSTEISNNIDGIGKSIGNLAKNIADFFGSIAGKLKLPDLNSILDGIKNFVNGIDISGIANGFRDFANGLRGIEEGTQALGDTGEAAEKTESVWVTIGKALRAIGDAIVNIFEKVDVPGLLQGIAAVMTGMGMMNIGNFFTELPGTLKDLKSNVGSLTGVFEELRGTLENFSKTLQTGRIAIIALSILAIAAAVKIVSDINPDNIIAGLGALSTGILILLGTMKLFAAVFKSTDFKGLTWQTVGLMWALGNAAKDMAFSVDLLSKIPADQLRAGVLAMGAVLLELAAFYYLMEDVDIKTFGFQLLELGLAIRVMALSIEALGKMTGDSMFNGLLGFATILITVSYALNQMKNIKPKTLSAIGKSLIEISIAMRIFAMSVNALAEKSLEEMSQGLIGFAAIIITMCYAFNQLNAVDNKSLNAIGSSMIMMSVAVRVLAASVKALSEIEADKLAYSVGSIAGMVILLAEAFIKMNAVNNKDLLTISSSMILMGVAVKILSDSIVTIGNLNPNQAIQGFAAIAAMILLLRDTFNSLDPKTEENVLKIGAAMILMGIAVKLLASSIASLASLPLIEMAASTLAVVVLLEVMTNCINDLLQNSKGALEGAAAMVVMGVAIKILASAITQIGQLNLEQVAVSLLAVLGSLWILAMILPTFEKGMDGALAMVVAAASLVVLGKAIAILGGLNLEQVSIALFGILGSLLMLAVILPMFDKGLEGAAALTVAAVGLAVLCAALRLLGTLTLPGLVISLAALAGAMFIMGAAAKILEPVIGNLLALAGAILVTGVGATLLGKALSILFSLLLASGPGLTQAIIAFLDMIINVTPKFIQALGAIILGICQLIIDCAPTIGVAIGVLVGAIALALISALITIMPPLFQAIKILLFGVIDIFFFALEVFLAHLAMAIPNIVLMAFTIVVEFIGGLADAIDKNHDKLNENIGHLIIVILTAIGDGIIDMGKKGKEAIDNFLANFDPAKIWEDLTKAGANLIKGIGDGIKKGAEDLWNSATGFAKGVLEKIAKAWEEHSPSKAGFRLGRYLDDGLRMGIEDGAKSVADGAGKVAYAALDAMSDLEDADLSPTISPVIDYSIDQNGIEPLNDLFFSMPATATIEHDINESVQLKTDLADALMQQDDYSSIISGMGELRDDLGTYIDRLENLSVVLDSGRLVGAIAPGVDRTLGRYAMMTRRGAM